MDKIDFKNITSKYELSLFDNLKKFVAINSVYDEQTKDDINPFGKGVTEALKFIEKLAIQDGFEVHNYKNMIVEILYGKGNKNITILAHADVVPAASGWDQDPFSVVEKDGILYGRGVADDKGPLLSAYYGLKALKDNNLIGDKYQIRFLVGGNEESGSLGVEYYFNELKKPQPTYGFSPDSSYPLIYGEKEIFNFTIKFPFTHKIIKSFHGGVASNSVVEEFVVETEYDEEFVNNYSKKIKCSGDGRIWTFKGKAAHGAIPWEGSNAALYALNQLGAVYNIPEFKHLYKCLGDPRGKGMNADVHSDDMGTSSCNVGIVNYDGKEVTITVNFRHVETVTTDELMAKITSALSPFKVALDSVSPLLFYPLDSELVSTLLNVYREETGDNDSLPQTTGGGTYAKEAENCIAFGMEYPGFDPKMHSPGERCKKEHLVESMAIYAHAIYALGEKIK